MKSRFVILIVFNFLLFLLFNNKISFSQEETDRLKKEDPQREELRKELIFSGLIFDKTKTKVGRDFYEAFVNLWEFPSGTENLNITIEEQTDPRFGTQIFIYVEDTLVYHSLLKPRLEDVDFKADEAVQIVFNFFMNYLKYQKYLEEEQKFM